MGARSEMERRTFLKNVSVAAIGTAMASTVLPVLGDDFAKPPVYPAQTLPPLPYPVKALDPFISEKTVFLHYSVHHKGYIDAFVKRVAHLKRNYASLDAAILDTLNGVNLDESLNRVASLAWNHNLYWPSMKPGGGAPAAGSKMAQVIIDSFGSYEKMSALFKEEAVKTGIGWIWIVAEGRKLSILRTDYFTSPVSLKKKAILGMDVWEHAYYLDYQNNRDLYADAWLKNLVNWDFAEKQMGPV